MNVYRHSGKMPLLGIPLTVFFGAATAAILGFVYSYIIVYDPIVYINALCTIGFGIAIGGAIAKGARIGKIRNPWLAGAYGLVFGTAGLYFAWVADYWARTKTPFDLDAFQPNLLVEYIAWFYDKGLWSIGNHGGPGTTVNGIGLGFIWFVEACVIVGSATWMAYESVAGTPFCEACNSWTKPNLRAALLKYSPGVQQRLSKGDLKALDESLGLSGKWDRYTQLDLHCCPKCDDSLFLTISDVNVTVDQKGNRKTKSKLLLRHLVVGADDVPSILAAGKRTNIPESPPGA